MHLIICFFALLVLFIGGCIVTLKYKYVLSSLVAFFAAVAMIVMVALYPFLFSNGDAIDVIAEPEITYSVPAESTSAAVDVTVE